MNAEISQHALSKMNIARSFSKAAATYDANAELQRQVVDAMMPCVTMEQAEFTLLNIGSGTGYCAQQLAKKFPRATIINLDLAVAMLNYSKAKFIEMDLSFLCADAESLPVQDESIDMVFSSLAIQWCQNYPKLFSELYRVLKPKGKVFLTTFGPETLKEVKELWLGVDNKVHVNEFVPATTLLREARQLGFYMNHFVCDYYQRFYTSFSSLAKELKNIGASNKNAGKAKGLTGKGVMRQLDQAFSKQKTRQGVLVSFDVINLEFVKE